MKQKMVESIKHGAKRVGTVATMLTGLLAVSFALAGAANAEGSAGATAVDAQFTALKGDITTVYIPALLGLVILGVGVLMGVKWLKKGASKA